MLPLKPIKVQNLIHNNHKYVWYQDDISLEDHGLVGPFHFGTTGRKKLKYSNMIEEKKCIAL